MRTMYDAIYPAEIEKVEPHPEMVAGYVNGSWPSYFDMVKRFPDAVHVSIAVNIYADAMCLDVEGGDASNAQAPAWCVRQRRRGQIPTVYTFHANLPALRAAFTAAGVAEPLYSIADTGLGPVMIPGCIAHQYAFKGGYDVSVVADYWPGVDAPRHRPRHPHGPRGHRDYWLVQSGDTLSSIAARTHEPLGELEKLNPRAGHPAGNFNVIWPGDRIALPN